jgi:hypothetical protein
MLDLGSSRKRGTREDGISFRNFDVGGFKREFNKKWEPKKV